MAKKGWGKLVALAAVSGAVAAGVSYVLQYKTYHKKSWKRISGNLKKMRIVN